VKLIFTGKTIRDILDEMESVLATTKMSPRQASMADEIKNVAPAPPAKVQGPGPDPFNGGVAHGDNPVGKPVDTSVDTSVEKPKRERTAKQKENDERLRIIAQEKKAAGTSFKKTAKAPAPEPAPPPPPKTAEGMDPAEVVRIRQKTIEDLQTAYADGHQKEVFELLARFGDGAKSFRELRPEAFVPIREAIDNGALT
jgi:hypothetical protein